jgi:predicted RNA-binding Zn-ribbon protein involved in translation (DUF1610 family)
MDIELRIVWPPDPKNTRRDPGPITFSEPPKGDCIAKCPSCGVVLEQDVAAAYIRNFRYFYCPACGVISERSTG